MGGEYVKALLAAAADGEKKAMNATRTMMTATSAPSYKDLRELEQRLDDAAMEEEEQQRFWLLGQRFHVLSMCKCFLLIDCLAWTGLLLWALPYSLPLAPLLGAIFALAYYAFGCARPGLIRPLQMLIISSMVLAPTILAILLAALFRESGGNGTKLFDSEFSPALDVSTSRNSLLFLLAPLIFLSIPFNFWQLRTLWLCQEYLQIQRDAKEAGYSELGVTEPFLACKLPQHSAQKNEPSVSMCSLPDYQMFGLQEEEEVEEKKTQQKEQMEEKAK